MSIAAESNIVCVHWCAYGLCWAAMLQHDGAGGGDGRKRAHKHNGALLWNPTEDCVKTTTARDDDDDGSAFGKID